MRFVRFEKPLAEIIGAPASAGVGEEAEEQEHIRQVAVDRGWYVLGKPAAAGRNGRRDDAEQGE